MRRELLTPWFVTLALFAAHLWTVSAAMERADALQMPAAITWLDKVVFGLLFASALWAISVTIRVIRKTPSRIGQIRTKTRVLFVVGFVLALVVLTPVAVLMALVAFIYELRSPVTA